MISKFITPLPKCKQKVFMPQSFSRKYTLQVLQQLTFFFSKLIFFFKYFIFLYISNDYCMLVISHNFFLERMLIIRCVKVWVFSFSMTKQLSKIEILAVLMQIDLGYLLQMQMQSRDKIYVCRVCKTFAQCKLKIFLLF